MTEFVLSCLDFVFFPLFTDNYLIIVPFMLLVVVFIIRLFYNLMHIGTR